MPPSSRASAVLPVLFALACTPATKEEIAPDPCDTAIVTAYATCPDGLSYAPGQSLLVTGIPVSQGPTAFAAGDLTGSGSVQLYVGTNSTITRIDGDGTTLDLWTQPGNGKALYPLVADLTGDGQGDLAIGMPGSDEDAGQVVIFAGPIDAPLSWADKDLELQGEPLSGLGYWPLAADLTGDGAVDLLVQGVDRLFLVPGPIVANATLAPDSPDVASWHAEAGGFPARTAALVGDLTGDGVVDLVLSDHRWRGQADPGCNGEARGRIAVYPGPTDAAGSADPAVLVEGRTRLSGAHAVALGDMDGDGLPDLVVAEYVEPGLDPTLLPLVAYSAPVAEGASPALTLPVFESAGFALADVDGDSVVDLVSAPGLFGMAPYATAGFPEGLLADIHAGPVGNIEPVDLDDCVANPDLALVGAAGNDIVAGWVGDLDGDAVSTVVIATTDESTGNGLVYVVGE